MAVHSPSSVLIDQHTRLALMVETGKLSQHDTSCIRFVMRTIEHCTMNLRGNEVDSEQPDDDVDDTSEAWKHGTTDTLTDALDRRNRWELPK